MFADEIRRALEAAPKYKLPEVAAVLWRAFGEGQVTEAEAEALSGLIEARQVGSPKLADQTAVGFSDTASNRAGSPRTGAGSRPRTDASLERRRRWAASGRLPPALAARFTLAEQAVLSLVAAEACRRKDCRLAIDHMAAVAGVSRSTVKNAIREAVKLGLMTVEERRLTGFRNDTNVVTVVSPEWLSWLRLTRKPKDEAPTTLPEGGGVKSVTGTPTKVLNLGISRPAAPSQGLPKGSGRPSTKRTHRNRRAG